MELGILIAIYMLPWIVAIMRGKINTGGVFVVNLFLGWTFLFWVIALAMAVMGETKNSRRENARILAEEMRR